MTLNLKFLTLFSINLSLSCFWCGNLSAKNLPAKIDPVIAQKLCDQDDLVACIRLATYYERAGQITKATPIFQKSCYASDHLSCLKLADIEKKQNNIAETMRWLRAACRAPSSTGEGCFQIALIAKNQGLKPETKLWMTKACKKGHAQACKTGKKAP